MFWATVHVFCMELFKLSRRGNFCAIFNVDGAICYVWSLKYSCGSVLFPHGFVARSYTKTESCHDDNLVFIGGKIDNRRCCYWRNIWPHGNWRISKYIFHSLIFFTEILQGSLTPEQSLVCPSVDMLYWGMNSNHNKLQQSVKNSYAENKVSSIQQLCVNGSTVSCRNDNLRCHHLPKVVK